MTATPKQISYIEALGRKLGDADLDSAVRRALGKGLIGGKLSKSRASAAIDALKSMADALPAKTPTWAYKPAASAPRSSATYMSDDYRVTAAGVHQVRVMGPRGMYWRTATRADQMEEFD